MAGIVRLDSVVAKYGGAHIFSLQSEELVENGFVGHAGDLVDGEREVRKFVKPTAETVKDQKAVIAYHSEINYDESRRVYNNLKNFTIEAGKAFSGYELTENDIVSVSDDLVDALADEVVVGNKVVLQADSHKLLESDELGAAGHRFVGRIEAIENIGTPVYTGQPGTLGSFTKFVVIRVESN